MMRCIAVNLKSQYPLEALMLCSCVQLYSPHLCTCSKHVLHYQQVVHGAERDQRGKRKCAFSKQMKWMFGEKHLVLMTFVGHLQKIYKLFPQALIYLKGAM